MAKKKTGFNLIAPISMITLGALLVVVSAFNASSFLAILGTAIVFWGAILLYITPEKHVPARFLDASSSGDAQNIERILLDFDSNEKGIYLPPKNLAEMGSSLIFLPKTSETPLPTAEETSQKLYSEEEDGVFLTPPGLGFAGLFERELGRSFTETQVKDLQGILSNLLVDKLELAEDVEVSAQEKTVTVELTGSLLNGVCGETNKEPRTHTQVGCLLASALACVMAKATGKPVTLQNETQDPQTKKTTITYNILT